jgi:hypothetical protein
VRHEAHRLAAGRPVVDRDDDLGLAGTVHAQPGVEVAGGGDRQGPREVDGAQAGSSIGSRTKTGIWRDVLS